MLNFSFAGRTFLLAALCAASAGCGQTDTTTTGTDPVTDRSVSVTTNKPVTPNQTPGISGDADRRDGMAVDRTNTGVNVRDRNDSTKTPFDQHENRADIQVTADIRKRVVDTDMSVDAQNVKIITQNGKVTLRGPVHTADEKTQIETIARDVAGKDNVDSQLEIAAN